MNDEPNMIPYATRLPVHQVQFLQKRPGGAARLLRTLIAKEMTREVKDRKRKVAK